VSALDRFCPRCGGALDWCNVAGDDHQRQICVACGHIHYHNPAPTAGALVVRNGELLLVRRAIEPYFGYWDIPGGFIESGEGPAETAVREVREETGLCAAGAHRLSPRSAGARGLAHAAIGRMG
jgi:NADH pyrophosphatase NudC (nudix superfamily)